MKTISGIARPKTLHFYPTSYFLSSVRFLTRSLLSLLRRKSELPTTILKHHSHPVNASREMSTVPPDTPRRISQVPLLIVIVVLLCIAEFNIPGGLTPRRVKQQIIAKRVAEQLDIIDENDPNHVIGGPLPIEKIHREAIVHRGVWIFALDSHLRLLLSWRAPSMKTCPMTWSPLGEHAITNETLEETAKRGLSEEARFIARPRVYPVGVPFMYEYTYSKDTPEQRIDRQWTQAYVILPRGDALDFRTLDDKEAQAQQSDGENLRYQGMSIAELVRHAVQKPEYFCNTVHARWMLQVIPLVVRTIKSRDKRLFRMHLRDEWADLVQAHAPVCCDATEHEKPIEEVKIPMCGLPCQPSTIDSSDADTHG